jgi:PIN domain nuclease of toxin-antitoxin system
LSAASSWEIAIKTKLGRFRLPGQPVRYVPKRLAEQGIHSLPITQSHSLKVYDLPLHHNDPFDRLLIAQAISEEMCILTSNRIFQNIRWRSYGAEPSSFAAEDPAKKNEGAQ